MQVPGVAEKQVVAMVFDVRVIMNRGRMAMLDARAMVSFGITPD